MGEERPDALLKSALEKIVYFEARSEQLKSDLAQARAIIERHQQELAEAAQREIELRRQIAALEVKSARAESEREQTQKANEALRRERANLVGKLLEASRIHSSDQPASEALDFDFAGFISELRSMALAGGGATPVGTPVTQLPSSRLSPVPAVVPLQDATPLERQAERMLNEGRLRMSDGELHELSDPRAASRSARPVTAEETLFGFSVRELSATDPSARIRAAERLKAMRNVASGPPLFSALQIETDPAVKVALLGAYADVVSAEGASALEPHLQAREPEVRVAALKALMQLDPSMAGPHLAAAMKDPDSAVRRRASLLVLSLQGEAAISLGEEAVRDSDPEVRTLGALVLGAGGGDRARELLLSALRDSDKKVRQSASQSLSRLLGCDLSEIVGLDDAQRRREVRRLAALPLKPRLGPGPSEPSKVARPRRSVPQMDSPKAPVSPPARVVGTAVAKAPARVATLAPAARAVPSAPEALVTQLMMEIRVSIRGKTVPDLAGLANASPTAVEQACEVLASRGLVVRRGLKYFAA